MQTFKARSRQKPSEPSLEASPRTTRADAPPEPVSEPADPEEQLRQVRELLVGPQVREQRDEMTRFEERLGREVSALRDRIIQEIGALDRHFTNKLNALTERLNGEHRQRQTSGEQLTQRLNDLTRDLQREVGELEKRASKAQQELRDHLLTTTNLLTDTLKQRHDETLRRMNEGLEELRTSKTDRKTLSMLLTDVAKHLNVASRSNAR